MAVYIIRAITNVTKQAFITMPLRLLLFLFMSCTMPSLHAQVTRADEPGRTYYDSTYHQVYEVFHYQLQYQFTTDQYTHQKKFLGTVTIKDGPYVRYYPDGKLECTGYYAVNEKDSTWKYYSKKGSLIKTELYRDQQLVP